jgi:serine/threonine-protein kinase
MAALPSSIGRYRPVALLGSGAMGTVYKAHDPLIDRMVAIKVVRAEALDPGTRAAFLERFRLEVQAAGRCSHPAIVGVHDFVGDAGDPSIVMELVEGHTLQHILRDPAARAALPAVPILLQVLGGLGYAHGQGVIHRDIKPANIIVTPSGQAKIADFGIARLNEAVMTHSGAMLGTPNYMAPEQVSDDTVDRRADLFAVGAILFEALAGRPPFAGRTVADTIQRLMGPEAADMAAIVTDRQCIPVLQRALAKDRSRRFQTAAEFATALQIAADPAQATVVPSARRSPGRAWDPALLQRVERQLAVHLGPMARRAVAQAAADAGSAEDLYATLARSLPNATDRSAFLRALGGARVEPSLTVAGRADPAVTGSARTQAPPAVIPPAVIPPAVIPPAVIPSAVIPPAVIPSAGSPSAVIPAEAVTAAQSVLAFFVGPIARVLVRDAAAQAVSARDFINRLCAHVPKPEEQTMLRRRLRADVEPRLR